ncbi:MAG: glycosyl hydrolase [Prolixibacteraceae bacterium]
MIKPAQIKNTSWLILGLASLFISGCQPEQKKEADKINDFATLQNKFLDPPSEYRSAPLWDWNDKITEEGIDFQMKKFKEGGLGGIFVHPRPGLITEYISEDWHHLFDYTIQKGKELGMKVWIYDENSYPSGFAGGHVQAEMPDSYSHGTGLSWKVQDTLKTDTTTYEIVLKKENEQFREITANLKEEQGHTGKYYLFTKTFGKKGYWMGNFPYVDLLYKGVTQKFLEITMKGYEKYNKADFGNTLPGIFTDEPNLEAALGSRNSFRWTPDLYDEFQKRWGYDLKTNLPSLVDETGNWKKVRHDYYTILLEMFIDRWAKPYSKYCEENHLAWTGHYWEHGWPKPTDGMDEAAFYIYHQQPGVDMLGNTYTPGGLGGQFGNTRALRELHSAANQGGHNRTLSETYGGAGWEINFANLKRLVDWEVVLGVNFVNQHLSYFTMKGVRKFDYPPSFSYHEPWWDNYKPMGDYIGRISMAMSSGEQINRTVVLQPNTTAWSYFSRKVQNATIDTIQNDFKRFIYQLERAHFEYDLGSEFVLHTIGSVNKGQMIIGKRSYNLVVIPATMENIEQGTYKLLKDYLLQGGRILSFTKNLPRVDGVDSKMVSELMTSFSKQWTFVATTGDDKVRSSMADPDFDITESLPVAGELYHQRRILKDGELLFFVNTDTAQTVSATITGNGKSLIQMDPATGKSVLVPVKSENGQITFDIELAPIGSAIYYLTKSNASALAAADIASSAPTAAENGAYIETTVSEKTETTVSQEADNVLVLDYVDLKGRKLDLKETHFMKAMHALFDSSGFKMGNPWQHKIQYKQDYMALDTFRTGSGFEVSYHFNVAANADLTSLSGIDIVAERPEIWDVYLNGEKLTKSDKWWIDREFFRFPAGNHLRAGANTITLKAGKMSVHAEIMPAYVVGRFKLSPLKKGFELTNGAIQTLGSWKTQGYPFYAQKVLYNQKYRTLQNGKSYKIKLNHWNGTMAVVWLNGEKAGMIMTPPYEFELPALKTGENTLGIEVIGSLKSTFGFFYKSAAGKWIIGPGDFDTAPPSLPSAGDYILPDYGLFEPFSLISLN